MAKTNPRLFISLAMDDNIQLRNIAIKAAEQGIIKLSQDQRTFTWASNGRKLMTIPFEEHPYSAMASFFKTDEGMEIFSSIEKKLINNLGFVLGLGQNKTGLSPIINKK